MEFHILQSSTKCSKSNFEIIKMHIVDLDFDHLQLEVTQYNTHIYICKKRTLSCIFRNLLNFIVLYDTSLLNSNATRFEHYHISRTLPHISNITTYLEHFHISRTLPHISNITSLLFV